MDEQLRSVWNEVLNIDFMDGIISNAAKQQEITKIKLRPFLLKDRLKFQVTSYKGKQVFHENISKEELLEHLKAGLAVEKYVSNRYRSRQKRSIFRC